MKAQRRHHRVRIDPTYLDATWQMLVLCRHCFHPSDVGRTTVVAALNADKKRRPRYSRFEDDVNFSLCPGNSVLKHP
jgi:hypothetical protein